MFNGGQRSARCHREIYFDSIDCKDDSEPIDGFETQWIGRADSLHEEQSGRKGWIIRAAETFMPAKCRRRNCSRILRMLRLIIFLIITARHFLLISLPTKASSVWRPACIDAHTPTHTHTRTDGRTDGRTGVSIGNNVYPSTSPPHVAPSISVYLFLLSAYAQFCAFNHNQINCGRSAGSNFDQW